MKCPTHYTDCTSVGRLHLISSQPLVDCGNYLFRCKKCEQLICPACGIVKEGRAFA